HNVIIGGVVFGALAGITYWVPKAFGFTLDERWGQASFWCWPIGFWLPFTPPSAPGLIGMTPRPQHIAPPGWQPHVLVAGGRGHRQFRRNPLPDRTALCQLPHERNAPRPDRRPVERPDAGMGDLLAAAGLQLRGVAQSRDHRRVLAHEAHRAGPGRAGL